MIGQGYRRKHVAILLVSVGLFLGIKLFIIDNIYRKYPKVSAVPVLVSYSKLIPCAGEGEI